MYHHLNAWLTELRLKNREALDFQLQQLQQLEIESSEAEAVFQRLTRKLASLQENAPGIFNKDCKDAEHLDEIDDLLTQLSSYNDEVEQYSQKIIDLGQEAIKLYYRGAEEIEKDDICSQVIRIASAFREVYSPVLYTCSDKVEELLADLDGYKERVSSFLNEMKNSTLNINFKEHSYYMHYFLAPGPGHAEEECRFVIKNTGQQISKLNEQTSEHFNKVAKSKLVCLQGFTNRALGTQSNGDPLNNKMGFLMDENFIQNFYFFNTLTPKRSPPTCGICDQKGHFQTWCKLPCTKCGKYFYKGHNKSTCGLQVLPTSPMHFLEPLQR